VEKAAGAYRIQ